MRNLKKFIADRDKFFLVSGILHSSRAFIGPEVLHVDLTNVCNFSCIACWCRSPLLEEKGMPEWERKLALSTDVVKKAFDDLAGMGGLMMVKLVGGGEPFMHPDILEIVEYIKGKNKNIAIDINTNFSLVDRSVIGRLLELGVDSLTVSLWAGTSKSYVAVHPMQKEDIFYKIKDNLKFISTEKNRLNIKRPRIVLHDVIMNLNYGDMWEMLQFGLDVGADDIQFVPIDPVKGKTESLLLNDSQRAELLQVAHKILTRYNRNNFEYLSEDGRSITLSDFEGFIRRIEKLDTKSGVYDELRVAMIPCYVGWLFARIMATGNVVPCCKGHRMTMGNVNEDSFKRIWNGKRYREFRNKAKNMDKSNPYFSLFGNDASTDTGCYNCDNLWQNEPMHRLIKSLPLHKRKFLFFK